MTQAELGKRLGVEGPTVSRWETGRTPVPRDQVNSLSNVLGIPTSALEEAMGVNLKPAMEEKIYVPLVELLSEMTLGEQKSLYDFAIGASRRGDRR